MIKFTNVFKAFPKGGLALKDVSFHVAKGEFAFLTGHSGAGKSTVMKLIYAEEHPTSGDVRVSGYDVNEMRPRDVPLLRRRLGIVFQDFRLLEDRTAEENVAFALEVTGARSSTIPARVMRVLTQVGLAAKAQAYPRELSGGEQQRVAIARAPALGAVGDDDRLLAVRAGIVRPGGREPPGRAARRGRAGRGGGVSAARRADRGDRPGAQGRRGLSGSAVRDVRLRRRRAGPRTR